MRQPHRLCKARFLIEPLEPRVLPAALVALNPGETLLRAGQTGTLAGATALVVEGGSALAFVDADLRITGLSLGDGARLKVLTDVHGDIVTNLDADGTLSDGLAVDDGRALRYASIAGLTVFGNVAGDVLAGGHITNVNISGTVGWIATGTAATEGGRGDVDLDGAGASGRDLALLPFRPAAGQVAGSISRVTLGAGLDGMATSDGGEIEGVAPAAVVTADFDGDGRLDLAVANSLSNGVSIFLGTGSGTFRFRSQLAVGVGPVALTTADFNGDGRLDLAVANRDGNNITVLFGQGNGSFANRHDYASGDAPVALVAAELNGDGFVDLAVANAGGDSVAVFLNDGSGQFAHHQTVAVGDRPVGIAAGNFDGGTDLELAVVHETSRDLHILLNDGAGTLSAGSTIPLGFTPLAVAAGGLKADANPNVLADLVVAVGFSGGSGRVASLVGGGDGTFGAPQVISVGSRLTHVVIANFDYVGNNDNDLAVVDFGLDRARVLVGNGEGSFVEAGSAPLGVGPLGLAVGQFNNDLPLDLVAVNNVSSSVSVLRGRLVNGVPGAEFERSDLFAAVPVAPGGDGGSISRVLVRNDPGGYVIRTGSGGDDPGNSSGAGGSIFQFRQLAGDGPVVLQTGAGGDSLNGIARRGGNISQVSLVGFGSYQVITGNGGNGTGSGGPGGAILGLRIDNTNDSDIHNPIVVLTGDGGIGTYGFGGAGGSASKITLRGSANVTLSAGNGPGANSDTGAPDNPLLPAGSVLGGGPGGVFSLLQIRARGNLFISAGAGGLGAGFGGSESPTIGANGGAGGTVSRADLDADGRIIVRGGPGGNAVETAGLGGGLSSLKVASREEVVLAGGDGGRGRSGSAGGTISKVTLLATPEVSAYGGDGGAGSNAGGHGGWITRMTGVVSEGVRSQLLGGDGGSGGTPGNGGSLSGIQIRGNLHSLLGGNGGDGLRVLPTWLLSDDFDADGRADLLSVNQDTNTVSVLLGSGRGSFASPRVLSLITDPFSTSDPQPLVAASGDLNGDGLPDILTANPGSNNITVLLNLGRGKFGTPTSFAVGTNPSALITTSARLSATGPEVPLDLNGDGKLDVAVTNRDSNTVSVRLGNGTGGFGPAVTVPVGAGPIELAAGRFDGDGLLDLVVLNADGRTVSFLRGNGDGTFVAAGTRSLAADRSYTDLIAEDVNGDGKLDLVLTEFSTVNGVNQGHLQVLLGAGDGTFADAAVIPIAGSGLVNQVIAGQFAGDANLDLAVVDLETNSFVTLTGRGDGTFEGPNREYVGRQPVALAAADFNGDGRADVAAIARLEGRASVSLNDGAGGFHMAGFHAVIASPRGGEGGSVSNVQVSGTIGIFRTAEPVRAASVDFNNDGLSDLFVVNQNLDTVSIFFGQTRGFLRPVQAFGTGEQPADLVVTDLNGDGFPDVAVANQGDGTVSVLLYNRFGNFFESGVNHPVGDSPRALVAADFGGSPARDLAVLNRDSVTVLLNNGDGGFSTAATLAVGNNPAALAAADLDGVHGPDLVVLNQGSQSLSLFLRSGGGGFLPATEIALANTLTDLAVGDLNGDGFADLVVVGFAGDTGKLLVLPGNGDGTFLPPVTTNVGSQLTAIALGDLDGDTVADLALADASARLALVLRGNGDGTFGTASSAAVGNNPTDILLGRFDSASGVDLLVVNRDSQDFTIASNAGDGTFPSTNTSPALQYGFNFAGFGGIGVGRAGFSASTIPALYGSVLGIGAERIAAIVAGADSPEPAQFVDRITARGGGFNIGFDVDGDGLYDFRDQNPPANGVPDMFDIPLDGLILARDVGSKISGTTLMRLISQGNTDPTDDSFSPNFQAR